MHITTTNICGSDLHMYEGRTSVEEGKILGHENMGVVAEAGSAVGRIEAGGRVSVPFNIACGSCRNCEAGWASFCLRTNPTEGMDGAAYGYANMGPYDGGQAEYLRVPHADFNLLRLPPGNDHENDFTMLSDIFPTGWHGAELAGLRPGESVVVFGAGPVGLMAAHSAIIRGAAKVFVVDKEPGRLALAEKIGAQPVDFSQADPAQQILDATGGKGADCGVEAVGYQAHDPSGQEHPELVLDKLVESVRSTGGIGVVGVYLPQDPGAATEQAQQGPDSLPVRHFVQQGSAHGHRAVPGQALQPAAARPDRRGPREPVVPRLPRTPPRRRRRRLRQVRPPRERLDQGPAAAVTEQAGNRARARRGPPPHRLRRDRHRSR
ncbi:glutathione-independent formaldehyde dehydrogenase [Amycolatopsis dongchuanensis]|uniref:Glutathione-independent formaldehyde dehydrogenase n=1 Tax=Amycolatopsis dongchuanensis TaxID=1070866 RepID=A0ABP9QVG6_9PSEU